MLTLSYAGRPAMLGNVDPMGFVEYLPDWVPVGWLLFAFVIWFVAQWFARMSLSHEPHRKAVAGWLRHPRYTQFYQSACKPVVDRVWSRVCDDTVPRTAGWPAQFKGAMSARLYDKALLIAVVYPIFAAIGYWLWTGNAATIGTAEIVGADPSPKRYLTLGPIAILIFCVWLKHRLLASQQKRCVTFAGWQRLIVSNLDTIGFLLALVVAFAVAFADALAVAFAVAFAGAVAFAVAFAVAGAVALAFAFAFALAAAVAVAVAAAVAEAFAVVDAFVGAVAVIVAGAVAVAFAVAGAVAVAGDKLPARVFLPLHALCMCALICGLVWSLSWSDIPDDQKSLFVFLGVFPLINGIFDWVSYGVTLSLLRRGQSTEWPFVWGAVDVLVACLLFLGLGVTLVMVLHGLDQLAGGALIDLPALLDGVEAIKDGDWRQSWALFMVFSTMLPTGLHLCVSLIGLQGLWGHGWRRKLAGWIEVDDPSPLSQALLPMVLGVVWAAPIVLGCAALWALSVWAKPLLGGFFQMYFDLLMWIAQWGGVV